MTIKVIPETFQRKCMKCKSTIEFDSTDVKEYETNHDYLGDYDIVRGIKCPVCDNLISNI